MYCSRRKYTLQGDNKLYNDGDILESIEWYDSAFDITREERYVKIDLIEENYIQLSNNKGEIFEDILITHIISIK